MLAFLARRWFLLSLAVVLLVGGLASGPLEPVAEQKWLRDGLIAVVLFVMALPLEAREIGRALRNPGPPLLAILLNSLVAPVLGWFFAPLLHPTLGLGLIVAAATPCTLASASVWTRRAGGNDAVALLVTVLTNLTCFVVTPFWLVTLTGQTADSKSLHFEVLVTKLALYVVLPMLLAQVIRLLPAVGRLASRRKFELGIAAQLGVLSTVLIGAIQMGQTLRSSAGGALISQLPLMIAVVLTLHVAVLICGVLLARLLGLPPADQITVGICGSQKTLMVGLQVSLDLGVSILPMITYHVGQLLLDTLIVDYWNARQAKRPRPNTVEQLK